MQVELPDGKRLELPDGSTGAAVAQAIGPGLAKAALGTRVNGQLSDLQTPVPDGATIAIVTKRDADAIILQRHTLAHVLAQAVREYFVAQGFSANSVRMGIGPVIDNGFYYDFDLPRTLTPDDLEAVEQRMRALIAADLQLRKYQLPRDEALRRFVDLEDPYKTELIEDLPQDEPITRSEERRPGRVGL